MRLLTYMQKLQVLTKTRVRTAVVGGVLIGAAVAAGFGYAAYQQIENKRTAPQSAEKTRAPATVDVSKLKRDLQRANARLLAFQQSLERAKEKDRPRILKQILETAKKRKSTMVTFMKLDPQGANNLAFPADLRTKLPAAVQEWIEEYKEIEGELEMSQFDNFKNGQNFGQQFLRDDTKLKTRLFMAELPPSASSGARVSVKGIFLKDVGLALQDKSPKVLAVSAPETLGEQDLRIILVKLGTQQDDDVEVMSQTVEVVKNWVFGNTPETADSSLKYTYETSSAGKSTLPADSNILLGYWDPTEITAEDVLALGGDIDVSDVVQEFIDMYDPLVNWQGTDIILIPAFTTLPVGGVNLSSIEATLGATIGKSEFSSADGSFQAAVVLTQIYPDQSWPMKMNEIMHGLGHGLGGLRHAELRICPNGVAPELEGDSNGACTFNEYGDPDDIMGLSLSTWDYSSAYKERLNWLNPAQSLTVTGNGVYQLEARGVVSSALKQLKIPLEGGGFYSLEYRNPTGLDVMMGGSSKDAALIHYVPLGANKISRLGSFVNEPPPVKINPGLPFRDPYRGITVGMVEKVLNQIKLAVIQEPLPSPLDFSISGLETELHPFYAESKINVSGPAELFPFTTLNFEFLKADGSVRATCPLHLGFWPGSAGQTTVQRTMTYPNPLCPESWENAPSFYVADIINTVRVTVDTDHLLSETNELNNIVQQVVAKPDIAIEEVEVEASATDYTFHITVKNQGQRPTFLDSQSYAVRAALNKVTNSGSQYLVASGYITEILDPGESKEIVILEPYTDYFSDIAALLLHVSTPADADESNNDQWITLPKPDLQIESLGTSLPGELNWTQTARVVNQGGMSTGSAFEVEFRRILDNGSPVVDGVVSVGPLDPGAYTDVLGPTLTIQQLSEAAWLRVWADSGEAIVESSENNNTKKIPAP